MIDVPSWEEIQAKSRKRRKADMARAEVLAQEFFEEEQARKIAAPCIFEMAWPPEPAEVLCSCNPDEMWYVH